jgi:hypothetical protein
MMEIEKPVQVKKSLPKNQKRNVPYTPKVESLEEAQALIKASLSEEREKAEKSMEDSPTISPMIVKKKQAHGNPLDSISMYLLVTRNCKKIFFFVIFFVDFFLGDSIVTWNSFFFLGIERPKTSTSTFWKGGLVVDGQFVCNILALTKTDQPNEIFRR